MKEHYKQKAGDYIVSITHRIDQVQQMLDGRKQANEQDAKLYLEQVRKGLSELQELIDIS